MYLVTLHHRYFSATTIPATEKQLTLTCLFLGALCRCRLIQGALTGEGEVMDQSEEDSVVLDHHQKEVEQQPSDQSVVHAGSPDQMEVREQPTRGQEGDGGEELDTDLEADGTLR